MTRQLMRGLLVAAIAACGLLGATAAAHAQAPTACPSTFDVPFPEQIGSYAVPAGSYRLTVLNAAALDCAGAGNAFRAFLNDWDGRLPAPWRLDTATATFFSGPAATFGFAYAGPPAGGGSAGGQYPTAGVRCPNTFSVMHDDRIGSFTVAARPYTITLLSTSGLTCQQAAQRFGSFLQDFDGRLPAPWKLDPQTATFTRGTGAVGFRVAPAVGVPVTPSGGGWSVPGRRCPGVFEVAHDDRIGTLRVPAGSYEVTSLGTSCSVAMRRLGQFLRSSSGRLPAPWRLNASLATFTTPNGGFRIKAAA